MNQQFSSAEELMDHLKKQIIQYSQDDSVDIIDLKSNNLSYTQASDLSNLLVERNSINSLWNVSADLPITSHRRKIGKFIVFGKKLVRKFLRWYVSKPFEAQTSFNGAVTRSINELTNIVQQMKAKDEENEEIIKEQRSIIDNLEKNIMDLNKKLITSEASFSQKIIASETSFSQNIEQIRLQMDEEAFSKSGALNAIIEQFNQFSEQLLNRFQKSDKDLKAEISFLQYRIRQIKKSAENNKLIVPENLNANNIDDTSNSISNINSFADTNSFDYLDFENRFRGSVEEIKNRQKVYLPYFLNKQNILDIGCGRGEFIELLIENNISVRGIDLNREMVEYCQDRGLPVEYNDAINYLKLINNNELGGLFLGQVIEHMPFEQIISLVELAYKKLKPGAYLIMETPNPLSLAIFYRTFYVDPTHVKPVHPLTIQYVVESSGFADTELVYSSRVEPNWWVPKLETEDVNAIKNIAEFNEGINRVNELLFGNLDYAIIAKK
ncbi:hypothetical protein PAECIP111891_03234 [Paenibacillus allorhizoplanae]|uniref:Methyltransferase domain-containing protein n=1 Tax=Paenibacillus allorhizoplanae TaxID=2905648 RepID=A0ABM9CAH0_9BACL|nr:class I SAM-dependent methyltransferase [Paenibacillus allorhizoplanae]CAH1208521.1 hypothetical protein PAECIP111891_03234 [Paenibacillus allorhizoplanae]